MRARIDRNRRLRSSPAVHPTLRARKRAAMQGDQGQPFGLAAGPSEGRDWPARSCNVGTVAGLSGLVSTWAELLVIVSPARDRRARRG